MDSLQTQALFLSAAICVFRLLLPKGSISSCGAASPPLFSSVKRDGLFGLFTRLCGKLTSAFNLGLLESGLAWPSCVQVAYLLALSGAFALK